MSAMSMLSTVLTALALLGLRPRLAPVVGATSESVDAFLGGRPGFFLITTSVAKTATADFFNSTAIALAGDLDTGTVLTFESGFLAAVLEATLVTAFAGVNLEAGLTVTLVVVADLTGVFDF
jgi:hypothetical protein